MSQPKFSLGDIKYGKTPFTSSPSLEHPDKIADQISDAVLDAILEQDPGLRVACETYTIKTGMVLVGGEITTSAWVNIEITRNTVREIGYVHSDMGFDALTPVRF